MSTTYIAEKKNIEFYFRTAFNAGGIAGLRTAIQTPVAGAFTPKQLAFLRSAGRIDELLAPVASNSDFLIWIEAASAAVAVCRPTYTDAIFLASKGTNGDLIPHDKEAQAIQYS